MQLVNMRINQHGVFVLKCAQLCFLPREACERKVVAEKDVRNQYEAAEQKQGRRVHTCVTHAPMQQGTERNSRQATHAARQDTELRQPMVDGPVHDLNGPDEGDEAEDPTQFFLQWFSGSAAAGTAPQSGAITLPDGRAASFATTTTPSRTTH